MSDEQNGEDVVPARLRLREIDPDAEPEHLARAFGSMALAYNAVAKKLGEYHDFLGGMWPTIVKVEAGHGRLVEKVEAAIARIDFVMEDRVAHLRPVDPRRQKALTDSSPLGEYNPELTPANGVRFNQIEFERIERKLAALENDKRIAEAARAMVAAEAAAKADRVAEETDRAHAALMTRVKVGVAIGTPLVALLGGLIKHFFQ